VLLTLLKLLPELMCPNTLTTETRVADSPDAYYYLQHSVCKLVIAPMRKDPSEMQMGMT
jgi:hypothetical protein